MPTLERNQQQLLWEIFAMPQPASRGRIWAAIPALFCASILAPRVPAQAATYQQIFAFSPSNPGTVSGSLVADRQGRLYGVTANGGANGQGAVFRLTPSGGNPVIWTEEVLHSFAADEGSPAGPVLMNGQGTIFGVTLSNPANYGIVYKLEFRSGTWDFKTLHAFASQEDGISPQPIVFGPGNMLFGVAYGGGLYNAGTLFSLSASGDKTAYAKLHDFGNGNDGSYPLLARLEANGNLIGATQLGGSKNLGTLFELSQSQTQSWQETIVYSFQGGSDDLQYPINVGAQQAVLAKSGTLYGCAFQGGPLNRGGIYALQPPASPGAPWSELVLHFFGPPPDAASNCQLIVDPNGKIVGTSSNGGNSKQLGTLFMLYQSGPGSPWTERISHVFNYREGAYPTGAPLRIGSSYYGATFDGADYTANSLIYEFTP